MRGEPASEDELYEGAEEEIILQVPEASAGLRLDKVLADLVPMTMSGALSRGRIQTLMAEGRVRIGARAVTDAAARARAGDSVSLHIPALRPAEPEAEDLDLCVLFEDDDLVVVDKPAGMAAHPAPGTPSGTLVNALLHHCGASLSGIGGVLRPGIVHRLDKDTSGVMVAAKSDRAHQGLSALFAAHDIDRAYLAFVRGAPAPDRGEVRTQIGRAKFDRQRMAVLKTGGREAVTHYAVERRWRAGPKGILVAARVGATLETGRTHQIRVHMAHLGAPVLGDAIYGRAPQKGDLRLALEGAGLERQALHARMLGFRHPITGAILRFETEPPEDMIRLESELSSRFLGG